MKLVALLCRGRMVLSAAPKVFSQRNEWPCERTISGELCVMGFRWLVARRRRRFGRRRWLLRYVAAGGRCFQ